MEGRITVPVQEVQDEGPTSCTLYLSANLPVRPGQFFMLTDYQGGEKPFSLGEVRAGERGEKLLGFTIKIAGPFTRRFRQKKRGDLVSIRGPYGNPFTLRKGKLLLVGGGSGIAPLYFLTQELLSAGGEVTLVNGARKEEELLFSSRFLKLPIRYIVSLEDRDGGRTAVDAARDLLEKERFDFAYAAGPELMMAALRPLLGGLDYEFLMERYMKCGVGICGSCTCDPLGIRLCVEGPVIRKHLVEQLNDFGVYKRDAAGRKVPFRTGINPRAREIP
ncbi:MAG TPA: hypothetical protein PLG79_13935 [Spirochaetales bacterium]|nr:hypothetical protein [Spirochaetales bacterium]HOV39816.1 hypothetical protein [Spirochaetales bacterium]